MSEPEAPSSERLLELLRQAREFITESQKHWGSIQHLTGDRRNQKRSAEEIRAVVDEAFSKASQVIHAGDRQLEPGERMIYLDRKRNDARAPLKAVRLEAREVVVREATIMK